MAKRFVPSLVQELAKKGDEIPEEFIHKNGFPGAIDAPELWRGDLLLDLSLLSSYSATELAKLRSALSQWGCFQVINHGIEISYLEQVIEVANEFFALPLEEKLKYSAADEIVQGYGTDSAYSGSRTRNWNDTLFLFLQPKDRVKLELWPQKLREMINEYSKKIATVNTVLCKAMSRSLGLEENTIKFAKHGPSSTRFNFYPRCPCPERVLGTQPHTDNTSITYLLQEREGLEILNDGLWYKVPVIPGALIINLGELGEALTNGVFKSAMHRVSANSVNERISAVIFCSPYDDDVEPLSELISADRPQLYRKFNMKEYRPKMYESFSRLGSRALDAFLI